MESEVPTSDLMSLLRELSRSKDTSEIHNTQGNT